MSDWTPQMVEERLIETVVLRDDRSVASSDLERVTLRRAAPPQPYCGRRPEGFVRDEQGATSPSSAGEVLLHMAELEAVSIVSFDRLAQCGESRVSRGRQQRGNTQQK